MRQEHTSKNLRRVASAALVVLLCCVFVAPAQARNIIRWYDDDGNLRTIELSDLGPYEQQIEQEKLQQERGMAASEIGDQKVSPEAPARADKLEAEYEQIKEQREQRQLRARLLREIDSTEKQIDQVDREMQEVQQEITYKKNRRARLSGREASRYRLYNEIQQLEGQLNLLTQKKQSLQSKKEALRQQVPPEPASAP